MILLMIAGLLSFIAYAVDSTKDPINLYCGLILFVIVFFNCLLSYFQEKASSDVMAKFKNMLPPKCLVLRNGQEQQIDAINLVRGDLVILTTGDKVPADLRLIDCKGLKVEQSSITGEAEAIECSVESQNKLF